jgi:phosphotransferase system IIB component
MELWLKILIIVVSCVATIIIALVITGLFIKKHNINKSQKIVQDKISEATDELATKFGGKDNIENITKNLSRVTVEVKDVNLVNKDEINETFEGVMFMGNKIVFVVGSSSDDFLKQLADKIK